MAVMFPSASLSMIIRDMSSASTMSRVRPFPNDMLVVEADWLGRDRTVNDGSCWLGGVAGRLTTPGIWNRMPRRAHAISALVAGS